MRADLMQNLSNKFMKAATESDKLFGGEKV